MSSITRRLLKRISRKRVAWVSSPLSWPSRGDLRKAIKALAREKFNARAGTTVIVVIIIICSRCACQIFGSFFFFEKFEPVCGHAGMNSLLSRYWSFCRSTTCPRRHYSAKVAYQKSSVTGLCYNFKYLISSEFYFY